MGTDIHAIFQKLDTRTQPPSWVTIESEWDQPRHYLLFAALANVRNGYGFAGCDTGDAIPPISEPRGLPDDIKALTTNDYLDLGDHSFSHLTAEEMLEWYEGGIRMKKTRGVVSKELYEQWDKTSEPKYYSGWTSGTNIIVLPSADYESLKAVLSALQCVTDNRQQDSLIRDQLTLGINQSLSEENLKTINLTLPVAVATLFERVTHVQVEWVTDFKAALGYFFEEVRRLKEEHGEVRLVFGFDS